MTAIKKFFQKIFSAISSFEFYRDLAHASLWRSLAFYACFLLLATAIRVVPLLVSTFPRISNEISASFVELQNNFPDNLTINWDGTELHSSQNPQPIYFPQPFKHYFDQDKTPAYLGMISTDDATASPSANTIFTITNTEVLVPNEGSDVKHLPINEVIDVKPQTITKATAAEWQQDWEANKTSVLRIFQIFFPIVLYVLMFLQRLSLIILEAVLFFLFRKFQGQKESFRDMFVMTLYFFVPAEILDIVVHFALPHLGVSLFSLTVWVYFLAVSFWPKKK